LNQSDNTSALIKVLSDPAEAAALESGQIDELIQLGAVGLLEKIANSLALEALATGSASHPNPLIREQAFAALQRCCEKRDLAAANAMYRLAVELDNLAAQQYVTAANLVPGNPAWKALLEWFRSLEDSRSVNLSLTAQAYYEASPALRARILAAAARSPRYRSWGHLMEALLAGEQEGYETAVKLFSTLTEVERDICRNYLSASAMENSAAREAILSLFLYYEDEPSLQIVQKNGWISDSLPRKALFFFLSGQIDQYSQLDFDHRLLISSYESADRPLRRRILAYGRQSGQIDWLRGVSQAADVRYLSDLGDADWDTALSRLLGSQRYSELWRIAQTAPARWSAVILAQLHKAGWEPPVAEKTAYESLLNLALSCWNRPLDLRPSYVFQAPSDDLTCLAIEPKSNLLAGGTTTQNIYLWDLPSGDLHMPGLVVPSSVTRTLAFSPNGELLVAAGGNQRIRIYRHASGQMVKTIDGHRGLVRGLAIHPSGRSLASAGFDGRIRTWRFPIGTELKNMESDIQENFCLAFLADGETLVSGGVGWNINLWKLSDGALLRRIPSGSEGILYLSAGSSSELFASGARDRAISVWNATSGLLVRRFELQPSAITGLSFLPGDQMLVTSGNDGVLYLWTLSSSAPFARLESHNGPIVAMALSPDGQTLVSAGAYGEIKCWSFASLLWIRQPYQPGQTLPLEKLQERLRSSGLPPTEKNWLEFTASLWQWTRRFDIEISEPLTIHLGEYDIEL
jgi:WD40 repeat protein